MAIFHMSISNVSRAKGSSSCASLAYIAASKVYEDRTHQTYSYGRKERVMKVATLLPDGAPRAYADAAQLFNAIEKYEQASNARTAKKIVVALPRELSLDESDEILTDFIRDNLCANGYCATYAIHRDKDGNNPHAHILVANRQINKKGEWSSKRKMEYALDEKGERIPLIDKKTGKQKVDKRNRKQWKRISAEQNPLDKKQFLEQLREAWAVECNKHLSPEQQIDHRSNAARGIDDIPTIHEGYAARAMEARGDVSERMEINRHIRLKNDLIHQLVETLKEIRDKVLNANIERLAKHDHENGWVSQIYATAKKWFGHKRTQEVAAPPTPPVTPPDELPVVMSVKPRVVKQVPPVHTQRSLVEELAAAQAAANKQKQVAPTPPTHGLSHRR